MTQRHFDPDLGTMRPTSAFAHDLSAQHLSLGSDTTSVLLGPNVEDADIDGLDIESAAFQLGVSTDDVWRRIRNGQLIARSNFGKVYVYTDLTSAERMVGDESSQLPPAPTDTRSQSQLLISHVDFVDHLENDDGQSLLAVNRNLSVLMDHLQQAKEENREIIRFTSDSMQRLTELTDSMLKMKDDVIHSREEQVAILREQIQAQTKELQKLAREKENLETVAKFIGD